MNVVPLPLSVDYVMWDDGWGLSFDGISGNTANSDTDELTWNLIFWTTDWQKDDVVKLNYASPIQIGKDVFSFTTEKILSVNNNELLDKYSLSQNYPNPFNPSTTITYTLPISSNNDVSNTKLVFMIFLEEKLLHLLINIRKQEFIRLILMHKV